MGPRPAHKLLKIKAGQFLAGLGYQDIFEEYRITLGKGKSAIVDIFGKKDGHCAIIECGGFTQSKMRLLKTTIEETYILPYGRDEPIPWDATMEYCKVCGHVIGNKEGEGEPVSILTNLSPVTLSRQSTYNTEETTREKDIEVEKHDEYLTIDEVAAILKIHRETVKGYIQIGKLKALKVGYRTIRIYPKDLAEFAESHQMQYCVDKSRAKDT